MRLFFGVLAVVGVAVTIAAVWSTPAASAWQVESTVDPFTDQRRLVATRQQPLPGHELHVYELVLSCGATGRKMEIRTFMDANESSDILTPRTVPMTRSTNWTTDSVADSGVFAFRRDDSAPQQGAFIAPDYPNVVLLDAVFPAPADETEAFSQALLGSVLNVGSILNEAMPRSRLVIAGLFPDETVEFRFDDIQLNDRNMLATQCWDSQ